MARTCVPGKLLFLLLLAMGPWTLMNLAAPAQPPGQPQPPAGPGVPGASPLDVPIAWLMDARRNFTQVQNYTSTLIKRERVRGVLQEQNIILFSAKVQPFSVYMKWVEPPKLKGQEVAFVEGRNRNMMRVKANGLIKGGFGFQNVDPNDRRVFEHSNHTILKAGLGHMIEENLKNLQIARGINRTTVNTADFSFDKRPCLRIETVNQERNPQFYCYRSILYLEKESKLPMRMENYDWPTVPGAAGDLLEEFSYANLTFNVKMSDDLFIK